MAETGEAGPRVKVTDKILRGVTASAVGIAAATGLSPVAPEKVITKSSTEYVTDTFNRLIQEKLGEQFAFLFKDDPKAGELDNSNSALVTFAKIDDMLASGYQIDGPIIIKGSASDEANVKPSDIPTAGLGIKDVQNTELAEKRATVAGRIFDKLFDAHGIVPPQIVTSGSENILSKEDVKYIRKQAIQRGFSSTLDLISTYNYNQTHGIPLDLPPKLVGILTEKLPGERYVEITVNGTKYETVPVTTKHILKIPNYLLLEGYLMDEFKLQEPDRGSNNFPEPEVKLNRGFTEPVERINQPRKTYNTHKGKDGIQYQRHRTGKRTFPT